MNSSKLTCVYVNMEWFLAYSIYIWSLLVSFRNPLNSKTLCVYVCNCKCSVYMAYMTLECNYIYV